MINSLVTGGAGFIGRALVEYLINEGHAVVALDNLSNGQLTNIQEFLNNPNFQFFEKDITDPDCFDEIGTFDFIFHLAAQVNVQESLDNPEKCFKNNVIGTYNLLEWIRKKNTNAITTLMGTCMVYDTSGDQKISEKHALNPTSPYAGSKLAAEDLALGYTQGLDIDIRIVRPFNTYGPYQKSNLEGGVVTIFCNKYINNEEIQVFGDGTQTRDLLYVTDCVGLLFSVSMYKDGKGEIFNGGTGTDIQIKDLAKLISRDKVPIKHIKHHHPQSEIQKLSCDNTKSNELLNWYPKISLDEGITKTLNFLQID